MPERLNYHLTSYFLLSIELCKIRTMLSILKISHQSCSYTGCPRKNATDLIGASGKNLNPSNSECISSSLQNLLKV